MATTGHEEDIIVCEVDPTVADGMRTQIPVLQQRRTTVYEVVDNTAGRGKRETTMVI